MPETVCPHYTAHINGDTGICQGCGATVANPASRAALETGLVQASGGTRKLAEAGKPFESIVRAERPRRK